MSTKRKWIETQVELCLLNETRTVPAIKHADVDGLVYHVRTKSYVQAEDPGLPKAGDICAITHASSGKNIGMSVTGPVAARKALLKCADVTDWSLDEKSLMDAFQQDDSLREKLQDIRAELRAAGKLY